MVLEVGAGVTGLRARRPGDGPVRRRASGRWRSPTARLLAPMPAGWSFAQAAAVPVVFLTAYYGLVDLAGLRPGERCWCTPRPAASGWPRCSSPGTWAPRCSRTASPAKWDALRGAGPRRRPHRLLARPGLRGARSAPPPAARGVDVVLELPGRRVRRRLAAAAAARRPVRRDGQDRHPRRRRGRRATTRACATGRSTWSRPARTGSGEMLAELARAVRAGCADAAAGHAPGTCAGRRRRSGYLSQARHVGKVVLTVPRAARPGRHRADHRRHRRPRRAASPGTWSTAARRPAPAAGQPARRRTRRARPSWSPSWPALGAEVDGRRLRRRRPRRAGRAAGRGRRRRTR